MPSTNTRTADIPAQSRRYEFASVVDQAAAFVSDHLEHAGYFVFIALLWGLVTYTGLGVLQ
jgi:hypothetical protein